MCKAAFRKSNFNNLEVKLQTSKNFWKSNLTSTFKGANLMCKWICAEQIAAARGVSVQAVFRFLHRKNVKPRRGGAGPCTHWFSKIEVDSAYDKKRPYYNRRG